MPRYRIDDYTEEVVSINRAITKYGYCVQCGMLTRNSPIPTVNGTKRSGHDRCYGCEFANDTLHKPEYRGETFAQFCTRKGY